MNQFDNAILKALLSGIVCNKPEKRHHAIMSYLATMYAVKESSIYVPEMVKEIINHSTVLDNFTKGYFKARLKYGDDEAVRRIKEKLIDVLTEDENITEKELLFDIKKGCLMSDLIIHGGIHVEVNE